MERRQDPLYRFGNNHTIPRLKSLRRVPAAYREALPLAMVKRYQCVVIGNAGGVLTVAIADQKNMPVLELLGRVSGSSIFPVLVEPTRMRLLIRRLERAKQEKHSHLCRITPRSPLTYPHLRSMVMLLSLPYGY